MDNGNLKNGLLENNKQKTNIHYFNDKELEKKINEMIAEFKNSTMNESINNILTIGTASKINKIFFCTLFFSI